MIRNLFWKKITGRLKSTASFDAREAALAVRLKMQDEKLKSPVLAEFQQLMQEIHSASFNEYKKKIQSTHYKDTSEFEKMTRFHKLESDPSLKKYFQIQYSPDLFNFLAFRETAEYADLSDKQKVAITAKLKKFKDYEQSSEYKLYARYHNSFIIEEYETLKSEVQNPEFIKSNAFWAHPDRWKTTPEYEMVLRYMDLMKEPEIQAFLEGIPEAAENLKSMRLVWEETFDWQSLKKSNWEAGFHYSGKDLIRVHSFHNEKQANMGGANVSNQDGKLVITTKAEETEALTWHPEKGFVEQKFNYTSDVIQTAKKFRFKQGIVKIKLRCTGNLHHAFWLKSDTKLPHINIFHFDGRYIRMENILAGEVEGVTIKGIKASDSYIYSLKWSEREMIWSVNNIEVFRSTTDIPDEKLYLALNSFIPQKTTGSAGTLEVDWIRVFQF